MVSARAFVQPYVLPGKVLHLGANYSAVDTKGDVSVNTAPGGYFNSSNAQMLRLSSANGPATGLGVSRTDGYTLWSGEGLAMMGPFHLQGEYSRFDLDLANAARTQLGHSSLEASGWYLQAGWMMTGESRNYDPVSGTLGKVNPRNARWGAWELAARYDNVDLARSANIGGTIVAAPTSHFNGDTNSTGAGGSINGGKMHDWTVGLNWYPNKNVKLVANYSAAEGKYADGPNFANADNPESMTKRKVNIFAVKGQVDF